MFPSLNGVTAEQSAKVYLSFEHSKLFLRLLFLPGYLSLCFSVSLLRCCVFIIHKKAKASDIINQLLEIMLYR